MTKSRASWMQQGKFGMMVHWLAQRTPQQYEHTIKDHNEAVDRFDLAGFLDGFRRTGADWLVFTIGQNTGYYASPNSVLDRLAGPGYASERDLVLEIAQGVKKFGKRFIAYLPAHAGFIPEARKAFDWKEEEGAPMDEALQRYTAFIAEYARRFGPLLDAWWFDGFYANHPAHQDLPRYAKLWLDAARAGNPDRAVSFNDASFCDGRTLPVVDDQDYLSGETEFLLKGKARFKRGMETVTPATHTPQPPTHCLWHCLVPIDVMWERGIDFADWQNPPFAWVPPEPHQMERPLYTVAELETVVRDFKAAGGGVTFNVGIFQEGGLGPETVAQLAELAEREGQQKRRSSKKEKRMSAPLIYTGKWHGKKYYFGLHYDLHAGEKDTDLGARCSPRELKPLLRMMAPDFVQTDCKGHPGVTSWCSKTPGATVSPGVVRDAMRQWRAATRELGMPLHCHYSGIWDAAAGAKHPDWALRGPTGNPMGAPGETSGELTDKRMCPRSPYLDKLMLPQMKELIDRYQVDGFWVDGDLWAMEPCYCGRCRAAWTAATGIAKPPADEKDTNWARWWNFTRESFEAYVTRYCDAIHAHKPGVLVCSNWLQTFRHPGEPKVPTDWISGDNAWVWGLDGSRCEARFLSTRGKHWDIMLWTFYCSHGMGQADSPWVAKPAEMLMQEAAVLLAFGGNVQVYENPPGLRDGRLVPWRQKRWGEVGRFIRKRRAVCQGSRTIPQIAVLHSEHHVRSTPTGRNLMWNVDVAPVQGAVFSLLESHYGVDILDEWALLPRLKEFPVVVAPEQDKMSDAMVRALQDYVRSGGRLLVSGPAAFDRFGGEFLGVKGETLEAMATYHVPAGDAATPLHSDPWRLVTPTAAKGVGHLGKTPLLDDRLLPHPAFTVNRVGRGRVAYVPANLFRDFNRNRYPQTQRFVADVMKPLAGRLEIQVQAPIGTDVALRAQGRRRIIHLVNRCSGIPNQAANGAIDEIPEVGPVTVRMRMLQAPKKVTLALEKGALSWRYASGVLTIRLPRYRIHAAIVIA